MQKVDAADKTLCIFKSELSSKVGANVMLLPELVRKRRILVQLCKKRPLGPTFSKLAKIRFLFNCYNTFRIFRVTFFYNVSSTVNITTFFRLTTTNFYRRAALLNRATETHI